MKYKRYYSHGIKYFTKWKLLYEHQIKSLVSLYPKDNNFYSIHKYYENGTKGCPALYFDLDGENSNEDAHKLQDIIYITFGITPEIWFSGNKGYHVIVDYEIIHPKCEKIAKILCKKFIDICGISTWDDSVYSSRRLWRIPYSFNPKGNCTKFLELEGTPIEKLITNIKLENMIREATYEFEKYATKVTRFCDKTKPWNGKIVPCIQTLMDKLPPLGVRHNSRVLIARYFNSVNVDIEEAIARVLLNPDYLEREDKVRQVFESIYNSDIMPVFGCKSEDLLRNRCDVLCKYYRGE